MTRTECIHELLMEYQSRRALNERELDERIAEAGRIDPEIARLREENASLAISTMRRLMTMESQQQRREAAEQMKQRGIFNNGEIRRRLKEAGLGEDYLEMRYRCPACRDTGYVGDAPARFCACFEQALRLKQYEDGSMARTDEQCFACFDAQRIPEEGGQRERLIATRNVCENYADSFPRSPRLNLLLTGSGGQGKTFLLNCIYERVISRGFTAVRVTAFRMFEAMRRQHLSNAAQDQEFDQLVTAPMLLIDDLGSEPMMRNITVEYLFMLLNERMAARRHTVIATNLSPVQLQEKYGERVASRLLDRGSCATILLKGKDLRLL